MTEKRFEEVYGEMGLFRVKDNKTGKCYKAVLCGNPFTETDKPILDILNEIADENEHLRNDNLKLLGLLGDIRALLKIGDTETVIKKINKLEKEMQQ